MEKRLTADLNVVANSNLEIQLLDGDLNIIQKLDDEPNDVGGLTSAELKAKFDESGNIIKKYINETLIPAVLAEDATEESRKQAEAARVAAEQGRVTAEEGRVSAEQVRSGAESSRVSAENARAQAETARTGAETTRVGNETARNQGETARVAAENARANAEINRSQAEQNRARSETARDQAETARRNSENIRATSEAERAQAERNRGSAEASRSQGEAARKGAESTRQINETARQNAESARQTAETNRTEAETARSVWEDYDGAKAYKAGNKVYWEGSSYVCLRPCTGIIPADGTYWQLVVRSGFTADSAFGFDVVNGRLLCYYSGDNPPPFRLGSDGHLYVDLDKSYDLGKVTGDGGSGGADGITPTIGDNGNWYLGDEDTGKPSRGPAGQDGAGMDVTGASVGQIAKITAVDTDGKPTAWEPVDLPSGGEDNWELIQSTTLEADTASVVYSTDANGDPFKLKKMKLVVIGTGNNVRLNTRVGTDAKNNFGVYDYGFFPANQTANNPNVVGEIIYHEHESGDLLLKYEAYPNTLMSQLYQTFTDRSGGAFPYAVNWYPYRHITAYVHNGVFFAGCRIELYGVRA